MYYGDHEFLIEANSAEEAVVEVMRYLTLKGCTITREQAQDAVNESYCKRPGLICPMKAVPDPDYVAPAEEADPSLPVPLWGQHGWSMLHLFGTNKDSIAFPKEEWLQYINLLKLFIEAPLSGCPECEEHFNLYLTTNNPELVTTAKSAAEWGWRFHNSVNQRLGKPVLTYEQAAKMWKWEI